ncbi:MAG: ATP-dependent DNA helicase RecG [Pseudomonadales bacterium]|nr:ATP-dependent DNA helicase RecG [Pseudomonadales bacterium]MCP5183453.1 ATP-dependent DNA helicase RecG [Pseudomonadales bacterium]
MSEPLGERSVRELRGVGPGIAAALGRLSVTTLKDLIFHLPHRYEDRSTLTPLNTVGHDGDCLVEGEIVGVAQGHGRVPSVVVTISDGTALLNLRFFNMGARQRADYRPGRHVRAYGRVTYGGHALEMMHPDHQVADEAFPPPAPELTPVYPVTRGLTQRTLRRLLATVCALPWPEGAGYPYPALRLLHRPPNADQAVVNSARESLALDELTAYQLVMQQQSRLRLAATTTALPRGPALGRELLRSLGFELTGAQKRVLAEILVDLEKPLPMLRLLQGDVGSGKTVIAAFAAIRAAENQCQTAVMAPTELLAEQHYDNFRRWLAPLGLNTVLLTGSVKGTARREALAAAGDGTAAVVVGTHALFQSDVLFNRLALVVIDEQHRFGVHQRLALRDKGLYPHQLVMTATPIPRTLTMAMYADMDVSVLNELPKGRQGITTRAMGERHRSTLIAWLDALLKRGEQAYWVCTLIEANEDIPARAAEEAYELLQRELRGHTLALLHGRMKAPEKADIFQRYKQGAIAMLVATTVIEVGVDVPNATAIIIENPERLGLAQLHQLRGRVGRGDKPAHCVLLHAGHLSAQARQRLRVMCESQDGFYLAEKDLELRGPGEVLGTRQTGDAAFRVADLTTDSALLDRAQRRSTALLEHDPATARHLLESWTTGGGDALAV